MHVLPLTLAICSPTPNSPVVLAVWVLRACKTRPKLPHVGKCLETVPYGKIVSKTTPDEEICLNITWPTN